MYIQYDQNCKPWCQTWPPCWICCCGCPCRYNEKKWQEKKDREHRVADEEKEYARKNLVETCGCCMCYSVCCPGNYVLEHESSSCGAMCICCDDQAKKSRPNFSQENYDKWIRSLKSPCCVSDGMTEVEVGGCCTNASNASSDTVDDNDTGCDCCQDSESYQHVGALAKIQAQPQEPVF